MAVTPEAQAQSRFLKFQAHQISEHVFSVALVAAAHTSKEGRDALENYIESGDIGAWEKFIDSFSGEFWSTRLNTEIIGYHVIDMPLEWLVDKGAARSARFGALAKGFVGRQVLGILGFLGYDFVADLNRCIEQKVADSAQTPLGAKLALQNMSNFWSGLVFSPTAWGTYSSHAKACLQSDLPLFQMAWDRFLDVENVVFWTAIASSMKVGEMTKGPVARGCSRFLSARGVSQERSDRWGQRVGRVTSPTAAVLSIGAVYQLLNLKPVHALASKMNGALHSWRESRNQDELQDLLLALSAKPGDTEILRQIEITRGALTSNLLAEINLHAKPLWELAEASATLDPAVRELLEKGDGQPGDLEKRVAASLIQLNQVREWIILSEKDPSRVPRSELQKDSTLSTSMILQNLREELEGLYFPEWWKQSPGAVAALMRSRFNALKGLADKAQSPKMTEYGARALAVMTDLAAKLQTLGAPESMLAEHSKFLKGLAALLNFDNPWDPQLLRRLELIERYSHMPRPDVFLARGDDLKWTDPRLFRILGQDPRLGLRGY